MNYYKKCISTIQIWNTHLFDSSAPRKMTNDNESVPHDISFFYNGFASWKGQAIQLLFCCAVMGLVSGVMYHSDVENGKLADALLIESSDSSLKRETIW